MGLLYIVEHDKFYIYIYVQIVGFFTIMNFIPSMHLAIAFLLH